MRKLRAISMCLAGALVFGVGAGRSWARSPRPAAPAADAVSSREPARATLKMDLKLDRSQRELYVGQTVPVTIRAYFLGGTGVTVNGRPRLTSDALLLSDLSTEPRQANVQVRGLPYTALIWEGKLTAVQAGQANTDIELPVALTYREAPRARQWSPPSAPDRSGAAPGDTDDADEPSTSGDDPFSAFLRQSPFANDPFFSQMLRGHDPLRGMFDDLAGAVRQRSVTLHDGGVPLTVIEPPAPRPAGFTGAVGTFQISAGLSDETFRVGEPTHLKVTVRGQGSFARLAVEGLPTTSDLNTYGLTSEFKSGPTALGGEKVFTQTIAPRRAGELTVPAVALTYFDPRARRYITRRTTPLRIAVAAADPGDRVASTITGAGPAPTGEAAAVPAAAVPDTRNATLTPSFRTASFWALAGGIVLATLALSLLGWTRRRGMLGRLRAQRRVRREIARQRRQIGAAAARGDAVTLFGAGRKALQQCLGAEWGVPPDAIAAVDVASRLGPRGTRIREVFERADKAAYAGSAVPLTATSQDAGAPSDLNGWQRLILDELRTLEARG